MGLSACLDRMSLLQEINVRNKAKFRIYGNFEVTLTLSVRCQRGAIISDWTFVSVLAQRERLNEWRVCRRCLSVLLHYYPNS